MQRCCWWAVMAALLWVCAGPLRAAPEAIAPEVATADVKAVRKVIESQLAAFAAGDATKAFSFAAPAIREKFENADIFMAMVRNGYPVVYRPASVTFLVPQRVDDKLVQRVQMVDAAGAPWMVVYELERQADRSWRISACAAARTQDRSA